MKICMILKNNDLLFDSRVKKEAASLAAAGHNVIVLAQKTDRSKMHELMGKVEVFRIPTYFWEPRRVFLEAAVVHRADAYHGHDLYSLDIAVVAASRTGAFAIYDSHELWTALLKLYWGVRYVRRLFYWMREHFLIRKADAVITVSDSIARILKKKYNLADVVVLRNVSPLAVEVPKKDLRTLLPIAPDQMIMVHIGGVGETRGLRYMIEALTLCDRLVLVSIGAGPIQKALISRLKKLAVDLGVEKRVHFLPTMPFEEMIAYTSTADFGMCLIQPGNLHYYSTIANKLFEYLLAGIPVIASNFPEMMGIVNKYDVGRTLPPDNPSELVRVLKELIENPAVCEKMKQNTRQALEENNWTLESKRLLNLYDRLGQKTAISSCYHHGTEPVHCLSGGLIILASSDPPDEIIDNLRKLYGASHVVIVVIDSLHTQNLDAKSVTRMPVRSIFDFIKAARAIARTPITGCVTIYEKSELRRFIVFDLLCLAAFVRKRFVYFPELRLSYPIAANIFLQKYLNRLETKLYFLTQFLKILFARRRETFSRSGTD